jgi:hypothetical protein
LPSLAELPKPEIDFMAERLLEERRIRLESTPEAIQRKYRFDPLGFVMQEWPWGQEGTELEGIESPDDNQKQFLIDLGKHVTEGNFDGHTPVKPVRMAISSGNGTGKTSLGAFVAWWILRTRPMSIGTVTSGNFQQLDERTWADIKHWGRMAKGGHYFDIQASGVFHKDPQLRDKWKVTPKTATKEKAHSFAGQHARTSTSWFLLDEASDVADEIWKECDTGLTDGESMIFAWGQMLANTGRFYAVTFGDAAAQWDHRIFDGRLSRFTNKGFIEDWAKEYGEDSDYYRVHVLGIPPRASSLQFIGQELVDGARKRDHTSLPDEPLVVGFDAANGGLARFCFWFRRGLDAKSIAPIFLPGDTPRDVVVAKASEILSDKTQGRRVAAMFGDQAFGAVILERLRSSGYTNVFEVNFGASSPDQHYLNMRAYMWSSMKEWMHLGAIPDDEKLSQPFMGPGFHHNQQSRKLVIESKEDMAKRRVKSPDGPDALALTFARRVAAPGPPPKLPKRPDYGGADPSQRWMGG